MIICVLAFFLCLIDVRLSFTMSNRIAVVLTFGRLLAVGSLSPEDKPTRQYDALTKNANDIWGTSYALLGIRTDFEWDSYYEQTFSHIYILSFARELCESYTQSGALKRNVARGLQIFAYDKWRTTDERFRKDHEDYPIYTHEGNHATEPVERVCSQFISVEPKEGAMNPSVKTKIYSFMFFVAAYSVWAYEKEVTPLVKKLFSFVANPSQFIKVEHHRNVGLLDWSKSRSAPLFSKWMFILLSIGDVADGEFKNLFDYFINGYPDTLTPEISRKVVCDLENTSFDIIKREYKAILQWIKEGASDSGASETGLLPGDCATIWERLTSMFNIFCPGSSCHN